MIDLPADLNLVDRRRRFVEEGVSINEEGGEWSTDPSFSGHLVQKTEGVALPLQRFDNDYEARQEG